MKFFYKLKRDKVLFTLTIFCAIILLLSLVTLILSIVQVAMLAASSVRIFNFYLPLCITSMALSAVALALIIVYAVMQNK